MSRESEILEIVMGAERVEVAALAGRLGVSAVTIRKDLDQLAERGLIRREHGFARMAAPDDLTSRLAYHYDDKKRIAQSAASAIPDGATVMIESGSVCALLAEVLCQADRGIGILQRCQQQGRILRVAVFREVAARFGPDFGRGALHCLAGHLLAGFMSAGFHGH